MQRFEHRVFLGLRDRSGSRLYQDLGFRRCRFADCVLAPPLDPAQRSIIRSVRLVNCEEDDCSLSCVALEDVSVENLRVKDLFIVSACALRHVVLRGRIGKINITDLLPGAQSAHAQAAFDAANAAFYRDVDWALDIREAEFADVGIAGIPLPLIRRDPETQVILPAAVTLAETWRQVPEFAAAWAPIVEAELKMGLGPNLLLIAGKRDPDFRTMLQGLNALRRAGLLPAE